MSEESETRQNKQVTTMVPQLGTSPRMMAKGEWDMRLLSYIRPPEDMPSSFRSILYALIRADITSKPKHGKRIRFWSSLNNNYLVLVNSIEGRGRNDQIKAENAIHGIPVQAETPPPKPNIIDKLLGREAAEDYERYKDRKDMGLE